jgi:erythromycin esterase-like protein
LLGEQNHGDAPALFAKTKLVKYLHEKHGFNILAFESDFYGLFKLNENKKKPTRKEIIDDIARSLVPFMDAVFRSRYEDFPDVY